MAIVAVAGRTRSSWSVPLTGLVFAACLSLAACDSVNNFQGPVSIKRDGGDLLVAVCTDVVITDLLVDERNVQENLQWRTFWRASGRAAISEGQVLSTAGTIPEMEATILNSPRLQPGDGIGILLRSDDPEGQQNVSGSFQIGEEGLSQTQWQHPDGNLKNEPCVVQE